MNTELINKYFPGLTETQKEQFSKLDSIYRLWNSQINVISRKDIDNLYLHHILHSLSISKVINFKKHTKVLDIGTGGGFPGIPLCILFPDVNFTLSDSIAKKIKVVEAVKDELQLKNCITVTQRSENIQNKFHFIISRAVTTLPDFIKWTKGKFLKENLNEINNGILYLKGGELNEELNSLKRKFKVFSISDYFEEDFFETKKIVYIPEF